MSGLRTARELSLVSQARPFPSQCAVTESDRSCERVWLARLHEVQSVKLLKFCSERWFLNSQDGQGGQPFMTIQLVQNLITFQPTSMQMF